jgi:hypothetical protein
MNHLQLKSATEIQKIRNEMVILINSYKLTGQLKPGSSNYNTYRNTLISNCNITPYQRYCLIGLFLSDASVQFNKEGSAGRVKVQQTIRHYDFVFHLINDVFSEWCFQNNPKSASKSRC